MRGEDQRLHTLHVPAATGCHERRAALAVARVDECLCGVVDDGAHSERVPGLVRV